MARRANLSDDEEQDDVEQAQAVRAREHPRRVDSGPVSPSPSASFSSDKENRVGAESSTSRSSKSKISGPPETSLSDRVMPPSTRKRKLGERDGPPNGSQTAHQRKLENVGDCNYYDPEQSMEERRAVRKDYRNLSRVLNDSKAEYLAPGSKGLIQTLDRSNELFASVKQTSDATLDSRLLVNTTEISVKRTTQLNLGDSTTGIDVDDFVGKCISYMRRGGSDGISSTQRRRRAQVDSDDEATGEGYDEGDAFDWECLGRQACYPNNLRPPVPGFLLGPLSVQKRARKATQRRERLRKRDPKDAVRPEEVKAKDLEQSENSNLTTLCKNIRELLARIQVEAEQGANDELQEDMTPEEITAILTKWGIADDGGVPYIPFVTNPKSFGQTVENLFYVSFLIRDGVVGIGSDEDMMPTLHATDPCKPDEIKDQNISKHQAVLHLDFEMWEDMIDAFKIEKSIIPHREPDPAAQVGGTGWYA